MRAQQGGSQATDVNTSDQKPDTTDTVEGDTDNIISFKIKFKDANKNDTAHNLVIVAIYCPDRIGDAASNAHHILGAKRIRGNPTYYDGSYRLCRNI